MTRYHHGNLRNALLELAHNHLVSGRPVKLSLRELARELGVSPAAPYRHFANRAELLDALAASGYRRAAARLASQTGKLGIEMLAQTWSALATEKPGLFQVMVQRSPGVSGDSDLGEAVLEWLGEVVRVVEVMIASDDPEVMLRKAVACWAAVHGMVALSSGGALEALDDWMLPSVSELAVTVVTN